MANSENNLQILLQRKDEENYIANNANMLIKELTMHSSTIEIAALNASEKIVEIARKELTDTQKTLEYLLSKQQEDYESEFNKILDENKKMLENLEFCEKTSALIGSTVGVISGYRFSTIAILVIDLLTSSFGSALYWFILTVQSIIKKIPFAHNISLFDSDCYDKNPYPFANLWSVMVKAPGTETVYSYQYKDWFGVVHNATNQRSCTLYFSELVGNCTQVNADKMEKVCQAFPSLDVRKIIGTDVQITCAIIGLVLGGFVMYYFIKVIRLQTKLHEFNTGKKGSMLSLPVEMVSDVAKAFKWASIIGFVADIILPSQERIELVRMVTNSEVKIENKLLKKTKYIAKQEHYYKNTAVYKKAVEAVERAQTNYNNAIHQSEKLLNKTIKGTNKMAKKQILAIQNITTSSVIAVKRRL